MFLSRNYRFVTLKIEPKVQKNDFTGTKIARRSSPNHPIDKKRVIHWTTRLILTL